MFVGSTDPTSRTFYSFMSFAASFHKGNKNAKDLLTRRDPGLHYPRWEKRKEVNKKPKVRGSMWSGINQTIIPKAPRGSGRTTKHARVQKCLGLIGILGNDKGLQVNKELVLKITCKPCLEIEPLFL